MRDRTEMVRIEKLLAMACEKVREARGERDEQMQAVLLRQAQVNVEGALGMLKDGEQRSSCG